MLKYLSCSQLYRISACFTLTFLLLDIYTSKISVYATSDNPLLTFHKLYSDGIKAYLDNDWASCISYLELALNDWHWWNEVTVQCRKTCYKEADDQDLIFPDTKSFENDRFFEKMLRNTLCLVKCKKKSFGMRWNEIVQNDVLYDFQKRKPYEYLHLCYFKHGFMEKAANAAVTYRALHPSDEVMLGNLKFYVKEGGLNIEDLTNLELKTFAEEFLLGSKAYTEERYAEATSYFEKCLRMFWEAWQDCRLSCEDPFDQGWLPEFVSSVANHYTFVLQCRNRCPELLTSSLDEKTSREFIATVYHYLQYAYDKEGDLRRSCGAVSSALYLTPDDETQVENGRILRTLEGAREEFFLPDENVVKFSERLESEAAMLAFVNHQFEALHVESRTENYDDFELRNEGASDHKINDNQTTTRSSPRREDL